MLQILSRRLDWQGNEHELTLEELVGYILLFH